MLPRASRWIRLAPAVALALGFVVVPSCSPFGSDDPVTSSSGGPTGSDASTDAPAASTDAGTDASSDSQAPDASRTRLVFVIKDPLAGNFNVGDDDAADKACALEGQTLVPGASFMAGLCWRQQGSQDLRTRLPDMTEWTTKSGTVAARTANGKLSFVAGVTGLDGKPGPAVWTGCTSDGSKKPTSAGMTTSCSQWNSTAGGSDKGGVGDPTRPDLALDAGDVACFMERRWYCFEVPK